MKYIIWLKDNDNTAPEMSVGNKWVEQGDGPLTSHEAERIAPEIRRACNVQTRIVPCGNTPIDL